MTTARTLVRLAALAGVLTVAAACQTADDVTTTDTVAPPVQAAAPATTGTAPAAVAAPATTTNPTGFDDVTVTECYVDPATDYSDAYVGARGTITNPSSKASNYMIEVRFLDAAGVQFSTGSAYAQSVVPGGTALFDTGGFNAVPAGSDPAGVTCQLADVTRFAA